ncbi:MAG: DNA translocase FtsK 4TM domain-containing protein [Pseudomonadota bacterium]
MARKRKIQKDPLSVRLARGLKRLAWRCVGGAAFAASVFAAASLASYSVSDPTLNTATPREASNIMGFPGAAVADVALQSLGAAFVFVILAGGLWGLRLFWSGPAERLGAVGWGRIVAAPAALALLAGLAAAAPLPAWWPLRAGLGGVVGDGVFGTLLDLVYQGRPAGAGLVVGLLTLTAIPAGLFVLGARLSDAKAAAAAASSLAAGVTAAGRRGVAFVDERLQGPDRDIDYEVEAAVLPAPRVKRVEPVVEPPENEEPLADEDASDMAAETRRNIIRKQKKSVAGAREKKEAQPMLRFDTGRDYELPPLNLLAKPQIRNRSEISDDALDQNARMLEGVLSDFGVRGDIINVRPGPVVTLYELEPAAGVKSSRVIGLADDIARSMSAVAARVAVVPGRNVIGIELPNLDREMVYLRELLASGDYESADHALTLALGKSIGGEVVMADLARMPHLLIAGTTGSGKSVGINTMILSLLYRLPPDQCKLILIDPKMLELSVYEGIPHLLSPVVTDPKKAVVALKWTVREMEERYKKMSKVGVRNISGFNERVGDAETAGETLTRTVHTGYDEDTGEPVYETEELDFEPMPFIVVVIDEMADLMMVAGKEIEGAVQRLAQMARAAGIHLIMATQRPSVDVITGTIKANFPTRISFQVTSKIDSRTILGEQGSEQLLGQGDMLHMAGGGRLSRVHGAFVSDDEVEKIVKFLKKQGKPDYVQDVTEMADEGGGFEDMSGNASSGDSLYDQAVAIVARDRKASTSYIQRRLQIGYNRAATLIERMEQEGVVSPANHAGKREVFVGDHSEV